MRRIHELVGLIVGAFAFALIGWQPCGAAEGAPSDGGSVIMATRGQVQGFDPLTTRAANRETTMAGALVFSKFFTFDEQGERVPDLATSLDSSPDGLTWRLTLRSGLKFSNAAPYTARDVAHHFQRILDPSKNQAFAAAIGSLKEAIAIDDATVEFRLAYPWAAFPSIFSADNYLFWVMPAEHEDSSGPDLNRRPIGAGPYMMTEWKQDDSITFEKNPNYWNPKAQHLDKIVIRFLPDPTARFTAVKTGDIDIFYEPLGKQVIEARNDNTLKVVEYTGTGAYTLNINTSSPPLDDVRVRQALAYALDRRQFGKPIASFQLTQEKLVDMVLEIQKGLLVALHIGRMKDAGTLVPEQISFGKLNNVRTAIAIARQARTILGGNGVAMDYSPMRHANNLEGVRTYEGTDEMHILIMGRAITGIPAFS